jgi:hypothetical protein
MSSSEQNRGSLLAECERMQTDHSESSDKWAATNKCCCKCPFVRVEKMVGCTPQVNPVPLASKLSFHQPPAMLPRQTKFKVPHGASSSPGFQAGIMLLKA